MEYYFEACAQDDNTWLGHPPTARRLRMDRADNEEPFNLTGSDSEFKEKNLKFRALRRRYSRKLKGFQGSKGIEKKMRTEGNTSSSTSTSHLTTPIRSEDQEVVPVPQTSVVYKDLKNASKERLDRNRSIKSGVPQVLFRNSRMPVKKAEGFMMEGYK